MTVIAGFLAWYLAIGFLIGAISLGKQAEAVGRAVVDDRSSAWSQLRYVIGMLIVFMIAWFPFSIIYLQAKWQDRKART